MNANKTKVSGEQQNIVIMRRCALFLLHFIAQA